MCFCTLQWVTTRALFLGFLSRFQTLNPIESVNQILIETENLVSTVIVIPNASGIANGIVRLNVSVSVNESLTWTQKFDV